MESAHEQVEEGVVVDPLFVGVTRPAMAWGVTYSALLANGLITIEAFLFTKNLLWLLIGIPIHGIFWLICLSEPRFFDLFSAWGRTRGRAWLANGRFWKSGSYSPLVLDVVASNGRRRRLNVARG
jgi:type IV secretion system protein VirB3